MPFEVWTYWLAIIGITAAVCVLRVEGIRRTAIALLCNAVASWAAQQWIGLTPWAALLAIDAATAFIILWQPARMVQAVIGSLLVAQILWHAAFGWVGSAEAARLYLTALNLGGWLIVATLFGGAIYGGGKLALRGGFPALSRRATADYDRRRMETRQP